MKKTNMMALAGSLLASIAVASALAAEPWMTAAVRKIGDKPKIIEAFFNQDSPTSFWASMVGKGIRRDSEAEELCKDLHDAGMPVGSKIEIRILDAEQIMLTGILKEIGRFSCERK